MRSAQASVVKLGDDRYRVFVEAGRDFATGKRKRKSKTVRGSRKDAERMKVKLLAEIGEVETAQQTMTLNAFFADMYMPDARRRLRKTTWFNYERHYDNLVRPHLGSRHLGEISPYMVTQMVNSIEGQAKRFEAFKMLRQVMRKAVKWELADENPCERVDVPKRPRYSPNVLTAEEANIYIRHFRGHPIEAAVLIAIGGGLRRSEIAALDWRDVSEDGAVEIDDAITTVDGRPHHDTTKTEFSQRIVHLPASITARLNELRGDPGNPVLMESGHRMNPDRISTLYARHAKKAPGAKYVPLKNLRHTSLTLALEGGTDLLAVSRRAGHANVSITSAYYLRPSEKLDIAAASSLDGLLGAESR